METGDYISDQAALHNVLGWRPRTELRDGIRKTVAFYRDNKEHYW